MPSLVQYRVIEDHIALIKLNRPEAMNAMSNGLLDELNEHIETIDKNNSIRCTVVTSAGEKAFCAGADLKERKGMNEEQVIEAVNYIGATVTRLENMKMPVIAALNGSAFGGGLELALGCDIRISASQAKMGLTETSLAIIPGAGGTQRLTRLVGLGQSKRLIFTAKPLTASEARDIGLVEQVVDGSILEESAIDMAKQIAGNGPVAIRQAKKSINEGIQTNLTSGLSIEHTCYKETIPTEDRLEGLQAFKEKRKPVCKGK